jgi:phosphoenolpyruvate carboxykinase (ATP)
MSTTPATFDLTAHGITVTTVHHNLPSSALYEHAILFEKASIAENGALIAYSGVKTGRSPKDKRVVEHPDSKSDIWWGPVNIPCDEHTFRVNRQRALDYLNTQERLYCFDGFAGWDPKYRIKVRVICSRPYHALFMHTMLIRPTKEELASFGEPQFVIINAGAFPANKFTTGMGSTTSIDLSIEDKQLIILGTEYAGEMKKGVFTVANYFAPKQGVLSMHCSATADKKTGASSLLFGLSGTGKTTLSADPKRHLIGDDEHCWSDDGIFNIEGGCYAKAINLTPESEPDIFQALRFGAVLENVVLDEDHGVDYTDTRITLNTRGAYPIEFIDNAKIPCVAGLQWLLGGACVTVLPLMLIGIFARAVLKMNFMDLSGLLAGSMTDPPALAFASNIADSDAPTVAYATVYPLTTLLRILSAQVLAIVLFR